MKPECLKTAHKLTLHTVSTHRCLYQMYSCMLVQQHTAKSQCKCGKKTTQSTALL